MNISIDLDGTLSNESVGQAFGDGMISSSELEKILLSFTPKKGIEVLNEFKINPIIITGRPERLRNATIEWLGQNDIEYSRLIMYPDNLYPAGFEINKYVDTKLIYHKINNIELAFDDTKLVVDILNQNGIKTFLIEDDFRKVFEKAWNLLS